VVETRERVCRKCESVKFDYQAISSLQVQITGYTGAPDLQSTFFHRLSRKACTLFRSRQVVGVSPLVPDPPTITPILYSLTPDGHDDFGGCDADVDDNARSEVAAKTSDTNM